MNATAHPTREETLLDLQKFLNERVPVLKSAKAAAANYELVNGPQYVIFTGDESCPVWVDYKVDDQGYLSKGTGWGVLNVMRFTSGSVARNLAGNTYNGHGERGKAVTFLKALEMELDGLQKLATTLKLDFPA